MTSNYWVGTTFARTLWYSFYPLPAIELKWIPRNRSYHLQFNWLVFEFHLNVFHAKPNTNVFEYDDVDA